nr:hypothetical protein [Chloroflexota bacterium]
MRDLRVSKAIVAGIAGAVLGGIAQTLINSLAGAALIADGMMWGAVLAILIVSLSNFTRMGYLAMKSDKPAVNFVIGVGLFCLISVVAITLFFVIFWVLSRLL